jgi:hypothetical protein
MQQLLKMIEIAKNGIQANTDQSHFFDLIEKCQPFVFKPKNITSEEMENEFLPTGLSLDAPFSVFSIEMSEGTFITVPRPDDKVKVSIRCILAYETAPKKFSSYVLADMDYGFRKETVVCPLPLDSLLKVYIKRINHEKIGQENIRTTVKIGTGKNKKIHRFRKVIHVFSGREKERKETYAGKNIDWSHKWLVRGHWRKHNGIGKDREGCYCVSNFTWVMEHEKGPADALVVKKTRVVD